MPENTAGATTAVAVEPVKLVDEVPAEALTGRVDEDARALGEVLAAAPVAPLAPELPPASGKPKVLKDGDKVFLAAVFGDLVNPFSTPQQRFQTGVATPATVDFWIRLQVDGGKLRVVTP